MWKKRKLKKREIKKIQEYEGKIREISDRLKRNNLPIIGIPEEKERGKGAEGVLEQIIAEKFLIWGRKQALISKREQRTPFRCNLNRSST